MWPDWHCVGNICTLECKIGHKFYLLINRVSIYTAATADQGRTAELRTLHRRLRCTMPVFNGLGSILVWGGITAHGRTPLVINDRNLTGIWCRDNIFQHVLPFIQNHGQQTTLQQDNARPQVACVVLDFLRQQNVNVMPWSAVSPDLSLIEHVWDEMEHHLRNRPNSPLMLALAELGQELVQIWNNVPQAFLTNLIASMRRHRQSCIDANGGHTRYYFCESSKDTPVSFGVLTSNYYRHLKYQI